MRYEVILFIFFVWISLNGCSRNEFGRLFHFSDNRARAISYSVEREGETLSTISRRMTGTQRNWRAILSRNPSLNPRRLTVGQRVLIPAHLVRRRSSSLLAKKDRPENLAPPPSQRAKDGMGDEMFRERLIEAVLAKECR